MWSWMACNILLPQAPVSFFDITPIGRILNRFSSDLYTVDDSLPFIMNILLAQLYGLLGTLVVTCYGLPWFTLLLPPLGVLYYVIQVCNGVCHPVGHYRDYYLDAISLTHWGRVTHICVGKLITIGSDNGLSPDRRQAIIWTNAGLLSIGPLRTYFSENSITMQQYSLRKMHVKMLSAKWRPSCLALNVLSQVIATH